MRLLTFDLDDTLMRCGVDYLNAKQRFGEFTATHDTVNAAPDEIITTLNEVDRQNVETHGLSMDRFPDSFTTTYQQFVDNPTEDELDHVRDIGYSVFKTEDEYAARGFMDGAEQLLDLLTDLDADFALHLITAGDERVQMRKINGLGLNNYFDTCHIVSIDSKQSCLEMLIDKYGYASSETYHVGNSLTSDVQAALEADANAVYVPTHEWRSVDNADYYRTHEDVVIYDSVTALADDAPSPFLPQSRA